MRRVEERKVYGEREREGWGNGVSENKWCGVGFFGFFRI